MVYKDFSRHRIEEPEPVNGAALLDDCLELVKHQLLKDDVVLDISISDDILARTSDAYRRIRNTFRFLLSNLYDFQPENAVAWDDMQEVDRAALVSLHDMVDSVTGAYDDWKFHQVYHGVYGYVTSLSSVFLDASKDRLYSDATDSLSRRSTQTVLAEILKALVRIVAPILVFTSEEVWQFMPESLREDSVSVHLAGWPVVDIPAEEAASIREAYQLVSDLRESVTKALEDARNDGRVGKSQEAALTVSAPSEMLQILEARGADLLAELLIVASVSLEPGEELAVAVAPATGEKCPRCWNFRELGIDPLHPDVCKRCASVLSSTGT